MINGVNGALVCTRAKVMVRMCHLRGPSRSETSELKAAPTTHAWRAPWLSMSSWVGARKQVPKAASRFSLSLWQQVPKSWLGFVLQRFKLHDLQSPIWQNPSKRKDHPPQVSFMAPKLHALTYTPSQRGQTWLMHPQESANWRPPKHPTLLPCKHKAPTSWQQRHSS